MTSFWSKANVAMLILILVAVASLGMTVFLVISGRAVPDIVLNLLYVVVGFLGSTLGAAQGAEHASMNVSPPPQPTYPLAPLDTLDPPPGTFVPPSPTSSSHQP